MEIINSRKKDRNTRTLGGKQFTSSDSGDTIVDNKGIVSETQFSNADSRTDTVQETTASTAYVDVPDTELTLTLDRDSRVLISATAIGGGNVSSTIYNNCYCQLTIDGTGEGTAMLIGGTTVFENGSGITIVKDLVAGTYTLGLQFKVDLLASSVRIESRTLTYAVLGK